MLWARILTWNRNPNHEPKTSVLGPKSQFCRPKFQFFSPNPSPDAQIQAIILQLNPALTVFDGLKNHHQFKGRTLLQPIKLSKDSFTKVKYCFAGVESKQLCTQSAKLDMQIIVDASWSVGEQSFNTMMKVNILHCKNL